MSTPAAEINISQDLVTRLLRDQHPDLGDHTLTFLDEGWDNVIYRLGDNYLLRLPRREVGARFILSEQAWLPKLAPQLPIAIPAPVRIGNPTSFYPWHWSITPWFEGQTADEAELDLDQASSLADFLKRLHVIDPSGAPSNAHRESPLSNKAENIAIRMGRLKSKSSLISPLIEKLWQEALDTPFTEKLYLIHGDLHSRNMVVANHKISAIIDWGDLCAGDPATDLASFWMLFADAAVISQAMTLYGASTDLQKRAIGWAVFYGVLLLDTGLSDNPVYAQMGRQILQNLAKNCS